MDNEDAHHHRFLDELRVRDGQAPLHADDEHQDHEHDHGERADRMQICEIAGDPDVFEGWLTIPLHVIDKGQFPYKHVEVFFDLDMAVELIEALHFMIHEEIAQRSKAVAGLKRQARAAES